MWAVQRFGFYSFQSDIEVNETSKWEQFRSSPARPIMPEENEKQKYHVRIEWQHCHGNNLTGANWATLNLQSAA